MNVMSWVTLSNADQCENTSPTRFKIWANRAPDFPFQIFLNSVSTFSQFRFFPFPLLVIPIFIVFCEKIEIKFAIIIKTENKNIILSFIICKEIANVYKFF